MELHKQLREYLNCPCRYFPASVDEQPILDAYWDARKRGEKEGFLPILVAAEDATLMECLNFLEGDSPVEYRKKMLSKQVRDGGDLFKELSEIRKAEAEEDGFDWDEDLIGEMEGGEIEDRFAGISDFHGGTIPLLLAEIPVAHPWEIFAWLPFGGWNECPDTPELMAAAKWWYEKHGAVPAVMTHDVLEFSVPVPVSRESAMGLALEQYVLCPDIVDQGCETIGALADSLSKTTTWFFWWD